MSTSYEAPDLDNVVDTPTEEVAVETTEVAEAPSTDTPTEANWKSLSRKWESRAKHSLDRISELEEQLQAKESELASKVEAMQLESDRLRIGLAAGLPTELAERLQGNTKEEIEADAQRLLGVMGRSPIDVTRLVGSVENSAPTVDPKDLANKLFM